MEKMNYYEFAENDRKYLQASARQGFVFNSMCANAQNTCERYLKHVIEPIANQNDDKIIMRSHSLKALRRYIDMNIPDFTANWDAVLKADGFYFTARYPGDDSFFVAIKDIVECLDAVEATKTAVDLYLENQKNAQLQNETAVHLDIAIDIAKQNMSEESELDEPDR